MPSVIALDGSLARAVTYQIDGELTTAAERSERFAIESQEVSMTGTGESRERAGVSVVDAAGGRRYCLHRYDDVAAAFKDPRFGAAPASRATLRALRWTGLGCIADACETGFLVALDPPRHQRLRRFIEPFFRNAMIGGLRLRVEEIVDQFILRVRDTKHFDLIADLAAPLPTRIIAELIGFPLTDLEQVKRWSDDLAPLIDSDLQHSNLPRRLLAFLKLGRRIRQLLEERMNAPADDLLTSLAQAHHVRRELSDAEVVGMVVFVLTAGHATTTHLIGTGVLSLLDNPGELGRLRDDPTLIDAAVEEMLRFNSPIQRTGRVLTEPVELRGQWIPRHAKIRLMIGEANRDPLRFADPGRFDILRSCNRHLGFGGGIHQCIGLQLARMETRIAVGKLVQGFPRLARSDARTSWVRGSKFKGLSELLLTT